MIQHNTLNAAIVVFALLALTLLGAAPYSGRENVFILTAFSLGGLAANTWFLRQKNALVSAWLAVIGSSAALFYFCGAAGVPEAIFLAVIPVGLALLSIGFAAGILVAAAISLALLFLNAPLALGIEATLRGVAWLGIWVEVGLIGLLFKPMTQMVESASLDYQHSLALFNQSRDYQQQLAQALDELKFSYLQLERLNQLTQGLRQIAEEERQAKVSFVANVSHELRTPLNMIIGFCEMILNSPETYGSKIPELLMADLQVILRNSQHLSSLIDDVLDLSQIDAGQMTLMKEYISIAEVIEAAMVAVRPLYSSKGLSLTAEIPPNLPVVYCDRTRIREVILNLLSNAGRFTEKGGVNIKAWQEQNQIVVAVSDTGPGISEENLSRLFRPFSQLENGIRRRYGGTGLGLAISKRFVEMHDGKMWVESKLGEGATFSFSIPVLPEAPFDRGALRWINPYQVYHEVRHPHSSPRVEILPRLVVVEGDGAQHPARAGQARYLLQRHMEKVEVLQAPDLPSAARQLSQGPAQALVLNSSHVDESLQQLKKVKEIPIGVPVMILSLAGLQATIERLGVSGYLVKPIRRADLLGAIDHLHPSPSSIRTILIVDDEPDALQLFRRILRASGRGYRVLRAENGRQALEVLERQTVDLILLDLVMPEMDGFQFLEARRAIPRLAEIPIIVTTAQDPAVNPMVSDALTVTCRDGLSLGQLLTAMNALMDALSRGNPGARSAQ